MNGERVHVVLAPDPRMGKMHRMIVVGVFGSFEEANLTIDRLKVEDYVLVTVTVGSVNRAFDPAG